MFGAENHEEADMGRRHPKSDRGVNSRSSRGKAFGLGVMSVALVGAAILLDAAPVFASGITLGQTKEDYYCSPAYEWIPTANSNTSYTVPSAGHLKSWKVNGGTDGGSMQFEVWRPLGGNNYKLLYISGSTTLTPNTVTKVGLSPALTVRKGDVIGERSVTQFDCALSTGSAADVYVYNSSGVLPTVGSTVAFAGPEDGFQYNIAAKFAA